MTIAEMHGWPDGLHARLVRIGPDVLRWLAALLATLIVLALGPALQGPAGSEAGRITSAEILTPQGLRPVDLHALKLPRGEVSVLRARVDLPASTVAGGQPLGLYLSGVFSAEAQWNGVPIGRKGKPGASASTEDPGPIDAVLPLRPILLQPGPNWLVLRLSDERLAAEHSVIHGQGPIFGLRVAPFSAEVRRPIGYYAAPFIVAVATLLTLIVMAPRQRVRLPGTAILAGLLVCAVAELSRSVVDYPYPLQALRLGALKAGGAVIVLGCAWLALDRAAWRIRPGWRSLAVASVGLMALAAPVETSWVIIAGAGAAGLIVAIGAMRQRRDGLLLQQAAALLFMAGLSALPNADYMDQGLYAASIPLIAQFLRSRRAPERGGPEAAALPDRLAVGPIGGRRFLDPQTIQAVHAAGDYVEISLVNGRRLLEHEPLGAVAARLPAAFLRVHRSHIVNLAHSTELRSDGGGRYRLRVGESLWVPVSRTRISELRARLEH